jgi:hypothetical protein
MEIITSEETTKPKRKRAPVPRMLQNPLPQYQGEDLHNLKDFICLQVKANVSRSVILERLNRHGYPISRQELLLFMEYHRLCNHARPEPADNDVA